MEETLKRIEDVLEREVRPSLRAQRPERNYREKSLGLFLDRKSVG